MADDVLMTKAFADALGVTARQVKYWTDKGAMRCLPGTDKAGHGNKRLYAVDYLPEASLVAAFGWFRLPTPNLVFCASLLASLIAHGEPKGVLNPRPVEWYRRALAGEYKTYIVLTRAPTHEIGDNFAWRERNDMIAGLVGNTGATVICVAETVKRIRQ